MNVQPSIPNVPTVEGGGDTGTRGGDNGGDGGSGDGGRDDVTGGSGAGNSKVEVCLELETGNLQRNVTLTAMTFSTPISTGAL